MNECMNETRRGDGDGDGNDDGDGDQISAPPRIEAFAIVE